MGWSGRALLTWICKNVVDLRPIGGQRHEPGHVDADDVGRLDAIGGQGDLAEFPRRDHGWRAPGRSEQVVADLDGLAAGQRRPGRPARAARSRGTLRDRQPMVMAV